MDAGRKKSPFLDRSRMMEAEIGGPARPFYVSGSVFSELTLAGPNLRLVASLQNRRREIWTMPLGSKGLTAAGNAHVIVQTSAGESHPRFSPDGRSMAFSSERSGAAEVWLADSDGENPRQLTHLSFYIAGYLRWSPDAQSVAFHARLPKDPHIYVVRVGDGSVRQITRNKPGFMAPSWSTDGKILYADALEHGTNRIYSVSASGGEPQFLWDGASAIEAPGRELLIYEKIDQEGIYGRSLVGNAPKNPERLLVADYRPPWGAFILWTTVYTTLSACTGSCRSSARPIANVSNSWSSRSLRSVTITTVGFGLRCPHERAGEHQQSKRTADGTPVHSFQTLLQDLRTVALNTVQMGEETCQIVTTPTPVQQRAFDLLKVSSRA